MGASSSTTSEMKSKASTIDASVQEQIEPDKASTIEPDEKKGINNRTFTICDMETFSTVYRAKIKLYSQVKLCPRDFSIDCGVFDLGGHRWAIFYHPNLYGYSHNQVTLEIKLLTDTTTSLKQNVKLSLIDPSGRNLMVGEVERVYNKRGDGKMMAFMLNTKLDFSEYVKDDCLTFECIVGITKWSTAMVKKKPQSAITFSKSQEESGTEQADFSFVSIDPEFLDIFS